MAGWLDVSQKVKVVLWIGGSNQSDEIAFAQEKRKKC
jgi:hypothetical protein